MKDTLYVKIDKILENSRISILENFPSMIFIMDTKGNCIYFNKTWLEFTGKNLEQGIEKGFIDDVFSEDTKEYVRIFTENFSKRINFSVEFRLRNKDNNYRWVKGTFTPFFDNVRTFIGYFGACIDIQENKDSEEKNKKLLRAVEQSPLSIVITDINGIIEYVNPKFTELTGYSYTEAIGKNPSVLKSGRHDTLFYKQLWDTILSGQTWNGELYNLKKDGSSFVEEASINPVKSSDGKVTNFVAIKQDITRRKASEERIKNAEEQFRQIFDNMSSCVIIYEFKDNDFIITDLNPATEKIERVKKNEIIGHSILKIFPGVKEFGIYDVFWRVWKTGASEILPESFYKDERISGWRKNYVYKLLNGNIMVIYDDVTESKQLQENIINSQKLLQRIINLLPIRVFWKDKNLAYLGCNTVFAKDAGKNTPEELIGKDDFQMSWKDQAELYRMDDKKVINSRESKLNFEEPQTTPNGDTIWLKTSKQPLIDLNGGVLGILGTYEDITERKNSELLLKSKVDELEKFNKFAVDRELKMIELKKEIAELKNKIKENI